MATSDLFPARLSISVEATRVKSSDHDGSIHAVYQVDALGHPMQMTVEIPKDVLADIATDKQEEAIADVVREAILSEIERGFVVTNERGGSDG